MRALSTKPYLIRAIYEWCAESGMTPFLSVRVDASTKVPEECVKNGEITLNVGADATRNLTLGNEWIQFSARFGGVSREISVPVATVAAIFAKENGQGLFFPQEEIADGAGASIAATDSGETPPTAPRGKPRLQVVK